MRSIALLILTALLTIGMLAAQEKDDTGARKAPARTGGFVPTEEVKADTAIAFPTDI